MSRRVVSFFLLGLGLWVSVSRVGSPSASVEPISSGGASAPSGPSSAEGKASSVVKGGSFRVSDVRVEGSQRIDPVTVFSYIGLAKGDECTDDSLNTAVKDLVATGFFSDVSAVKRGSVVVFTVKEHPVINKISFEGNSKIADKNIREEMRIREGEVLDAAKVKEFQQNLLASYRKMGRFNARIEVKIIRLDNNRVNLVFEINEGDAARIKDIVFVGNKHFSSGALRDVLSSKVWRWYRVMVSDDIFDQDRLGEDQVLLQRFLNESGFAGCRVLSIVGELAANKKDFTIVVTLDEGDIYEFGDVSVVSDIAALKSESLSKDFYCKKGEKYNVSFVELDILEMMKKVGERGFAAVKVVPQVRLDSVGKRVHVSYRISQGERVYISKIIIRGNTRTRDHVIRRELLLEEGDAYSVSVAGMSEGNLRSTGFFSRVDIEAVPDQTFSDRCVLVVSVEERSTGEAAFACNFSTQEGLGLDLSYTEKNFFGTGKTVGVSLGSGKSRSGADYKISPDGVEHSVRRKDKWKFLNRISLNAADPHLFDKDIIGSIGLFKYCCCRSDAFSSEELGCSLGIGYSLTSKFSQSWDYTLVRRRFCDVHPFASPIVKSQVMQPGSTTRPTKSVLSSLGHTLTYRDSFWRGLKGNLTMSLTTTFAGIGGDAFHLKNEFHGTYAMPLWRRSNLVFSFSAGLLSGIGRKRLLIVDSFSAGMDSFRGFDDCGLGPRIDTLYPQIDLSGKEALRYVHYTEYGGATKYWKGSLELIVPVGLPEELNVRFSVFSDFGTLWGAPEDGKKILPPGTACSILDEKKVRVSVGAGISVLTPFGPLKISYAVAVRKEKYDVPFRILVGYSTVF
jgi:outer membrane protein insertion porin family